MSPIVDEGAFISLHAVSKWYGHVKVLSDLSMTLNAGERLVICGPSGSGKSTLLRCLNGLEPYQSGAIAVAGTTVTRQPRVLERVRRDVGMVFQTFNLFPHLTVLENCTLAPVWLHQATRGEAADVAMDYLRRVRMEQFSDQYPSQLSGGQQQRVAIARALCMRPKALMFDEPTSALDPEMTKEVLEIILSLARAGMTMICVTHEMQFARQLADRIIFMDRGQIIEQGSPAEVFERPRTERLKNFISQML
jgi:general L-amino acid transport system ATP-binding protein